MGLLSGAGKDAGLSAAQELGNTAKQVVGDLTDKTLPAAEKAVEGATDHLTYGLAGVVADLANRLQGAELPVDLELNVVIKATLTGKIGGLKLNRMEYDKTVTPSTTVEG